MASIPILNRTGETPAATIEGLAFVIFLGISNASAIMRV